MHETAVRLGVDVGGTFTDVVVATGDGDVVTAKVPTTDPQDEGVLAGIRAACSRAAIDTDAVSEFTHATTVTVNALLEDAGARTALVTTAGFRDVLEIRRQDRPALYDQSVQRPAPLVPRDRRFEIAERATPEGVETPVDPTAVRTIADEIRAAGAEAVAVCLLHSYADASNEARVVELLSEELSVPVAASHEVVGEFREYERTSTTVVDAAVRPVLEGYLGRLVDAASNAGLPAPLVMQGNGGVATADTVREQPVTTLLSGPAAGVVGAAAVADGPDGGREETEETVGIDVASDAGVGGNDDEALAGLVTVDMGGTSTDVSVVSDGEIARTPEQAIGGHAVRSPMVDVRTVGAGGGSVAWVDDGGALRVGPRSAGADPGPACYGHGGTEPTVTDAALELGYLGPDTALGVSNGPDAAPGTEGDEPTPDNDDADGGDGDIELDATAARDALADLAAAAGFAGESDRAPHVAVAAGVYRVAVANTARAVRSMTVERGHDPREHALVAFGGAGPMLACALADELGVSTVHVPPASGVLSAYGLLAADETHDAARTVDTGLDEADPRAIEQGFEDLLETVRGDVRNPDAASVSLRADCRYAGQRFELPVEVDAGGEPGEADVDAGGEPGEADVDAGRGAEFDPERVADRFHDVHEDTYGYRMDEPVDVVTLRVTARTPRDAPPLATSDEEARADTDPPDPSTRTARFETDEDAGTAGHETPVFERAALPTGWETTGPAIVEGAESTVVVPPSWSARRRRDGALVLGGPDSTTTTSTEGAR